MRIAFDGSALRPNRTGVGYYTEHLLRHLAQNIAPDDELIVVSNCPVDTTAPLPAGVRVVQDSRRVPRLLWLQARAPMTVAAIGADVVHFTNGMMPVVSGVPTVVTIHDMSLRLLPRYHPARRVLLNRPLMDLAARRAAAIVTVSETAKHDIEKLYGRQSDRVHVVYEAAAPAFQPVTDPAALDRVRRKYGLRERIILYVGTIEPRKNLPILIEAFARQRRAGGLDHQLVCVGPYGWLSRGLERLVESSGVCDAVAFTGYVPFDDLPALYSAAEMFVYPSMYEGFGLPVVEAMACGTPVVAGLAEAVAEIGSGAIERAARVDADGVGAALVRLAHDPERRAELSAAGRARAQQFSWSRAARQTLDIYRSVASRRHHASSRPLATAPSTSPTSAPAIDVLIGQAYFLRFDPKLWDAQQPYAPLGALYAAAYARERGYRVNLFDAMLAASEQEWADALDRHRPRFAVIYEDSFNYLSKMCLLRMRQAALTMIAAARARGIPTLVSGSDASDHPSTYLDGGADAVVTGEGDVTLVEALDVMTGRTAGPLTRIAGLCCRGADGRAFRTPRREIITNLDALPFPAWDLVDVRRYRSIWRANHGYFSMNVVTTRGCPYHCNWCAKPIYGQRYTARSPEHVVEEFAWLKRTYGPDHIWIADDIFGLKPGWIERFAELVQRFDAAIPFKCLLRADQVTPAIAAALGRARCRTAWIGAESGSQRILDAMEKGTRVDQIECATTLLRRAGIEVGFFLQFGYPGETREDIDKTMAMVRRCRPDDIGISVSYPLPGTTFYQRVQAQLGQKQNWVDSNDLAMMYQATYVPDFYRALHALVHAEFRVMRSMEELRDAVTGLDARPSHARAALQYITRRAALPTLRRRVDRLSRVATPQPSFVPVAVLTPQAAAVPTEQPR